MNSKVLSLALAGVLTVQQNVALAATDRTAGIGDQAIQTAQADLQQLKTELSQFDQALAETEKAIIQQDQSGNFVNGLTVGAAALGVAVGGFALYVSSRRGEASGQVSVPFYLAAAASSAVSSIAGMFAITRKSSGDVKAAQAELDKTQQLIDEARAKNLSSQDQQLVSRLEQDLKETKAALTAYDQRGTSLTRNRVISRAAQLGGTVLVVASMVAAIKNTDSASTAGKLIGGGLMIGGAVTVGGHIATIITGMQSYQTEKVLKEIRETRESLKSVAAQLN